MAIKVYKGGSWVNTTGISAIGNADRLAIGQTNTSLATSDKAYYLSFVDANHGHTSRQYEDFYTGIGITFSPISNALSVSGNINSNGSLYLNGTSTYTDGDIHSWGGSDGEFAISNEGSGPIHLLVQDSDGGTAIGIVSFSSESGNTLASRESIFASNIYPKTTDNYNIGKSATELRWNNVYANCFHGDGTGLTGTGFWEPDTKENLKAGTDAGSSINNHTCYNIFIGYEAGKNTCSTAGGTSDDGIADENIFIGKCSGHTNTTGAYNIFGGSNSGFCNTSGGCNVAFGKEAGYCVTGSCNIFLGLYAGRCSTTGSDNIFMGYKAGFNNAACNDNIFLGFYSGTRTTGTDNIALGYSSLLGGPTGGGEAPLSGQGNVAIGKDTGKLLGGGAHSYNVFLGNAAGDLQEEGSYNVIIGANADTADHDAGCQLVIGGTSGDAVNWLTGTCDGDIKPFRGIIDCNNSTGSTTETQVLTSTGTNIQWATNVSQATNADKILITDDIDADDNSQIHYIHFGEKTSDYDDIKVDSNGLSYYQARDDEKWVGIGTTSPHDSTGNASGLTLSRGDGQVRLIMKNNDTGHNDGDGSHIVIGSKDFTFENRTSEGHLHWSTNIAATGAAADIGKRMTLTPEGHVGIGTTNPIADNVTTALDDNDKVLAVGIVTAKEYYGTFKGTIDPDATITLDKIEEGNTSAEVVDTGTDGHFKVLTEGTEKLRITSGGDVVVHHNSQDPTHSTSSGSIFLTPPSGTNPNRGIMWSNTSDTHYVKLEPNVVDGLTINGFSGVVFATGSRTGSPATWRERFRIDSSGRIGLLDDSTGGTLKSDNFGTNNQVLTSKGPNAAAKWQDLGGIPASEANQLKITKTDTKTVLYLLGVENGNGEDTADGNVTTKTVYQKTQNTLFFDASNNTLRVPKIRGQLVAGGSWPAIQGDLTIQTNHLIPSSNVALNNQGIPINPLQITNGGSNYSNGTFSTSSSGSGTNLTVDITTSGGVITNVTINTAGTGYAVNDTITVSGGDGNATLKILYLNTTITGGQNLGSSTKKWAEVYAQKFVGHLGGTADSTKQLEVQKDEDGGTALYFGMIVGAGEKDSPTNQTFYTDTSLTYLPSGDLLTASNLKVTTLLNVEGNTTLGNQISDTVTWQGRSGTIQPSGTPDTDGYTDKDLGSTSYKWNNVYAKTFNGAFQGTATNTNNVQVTGSNQNKDLSLTFIEWESGDDDPSYEGLKFDADRNLTYNSHSNVLTVPNLAISGITTLGDALNSDKTIFNSKVDSNIVPAAPPSGQDKYTLGSPNDTWGHVYADNFTGSMSGSASQVNTQSTTTIDGFVTFVENNHDDATQSTVYTNSLLTYNSTANSEILTVGGQLKVSGNAEFEEDVILGSGDTDDKVTFNSKIAAPLTLGIGQILPYSPANVAKTAGIDLGSTGAYWKTIYAREFKGAITGNADTASALDPGATINLTTGNYLSGNSYSGIDFNSTASTAFTGSSAYTITSALNTTGVTAGEYGSTTTIPKIKVDSKGRISSVSDQSISLTGLTASKAQQVETITSASTNAHYLTFVDSNNSTATAETVYTDDTLKYTPSTDTLTVSKFVPSGSFPSAAGKIPTTKQVGSNITWEWGDGTASGIGRNYTLPLTAVTTGNSTSATWTLTDNVTPNPNTNAIQLNAGTGLKISSASPGTTGGSFTISMDTSSNTAFKYKNTYASNAETTNKADAVLQIYPENGSAGTDQKITIKPGTGIKFSGYGAQTLTIESDADVGASTVDLGKCSDINHSNPWHFVFADSRDGGSETLYVDDESPVPIKYNNDTDQLQTTNLYVTGNTILGDALADADTVTWNAKSTTILPTNDSQNLGSQSDPWGTVYANTVTGTLSVNTSDKQVLYTDASSGSSIVSGSDLFTYDGVKLEVADAATAANFCQLTRDGGIEICRTNPNTGGAGGAFVDFKDNTADDYGARIQLATHVANGGWNSTNDRGGLLFETGGTHHRHMLLTKDGVLGITRGTTASAILTNNGSNHTIGFVPGVPRDATVAAGHNIQNKVVLDVNGTLMLRRNGTSLEGGQITLNNVDDTIAYSIDVYGSTANNSSLRIIDEKEPKQNNTRGTQRFAMNRDGAITFEPLSGNGTSNINADYGTKDVDVLTSQGHDDHPIWKSLSALGVGGATTKVTYIDSGSSSTNLSSSTAGGSQTHSFQSNICGLIVITIGGGGGGGGAQDTSAQHTEGGGGGAGGINVRSYTTAEVDSFKNNGAYCEIGAGGAGGTTSGNGGQGGSTFFRPKCANGQIPGIVGNNCATTGETNSLYALQLHTAGGAGGTGGGSSAGNGGEGGISYQWGNIALRGNRGQNGEKYKIRGFGDDEIFWGRQKPLGGITPFGVQFSPVSGWPNRAGWGKGGDGAYHAGQSGSMNGEGGGSGAIIMIEILK